MCYKRRSFANATGPRPDASSDTFPTGTSMEDLVQLVAQKTGLSPEKAERAIGIMLNLVKNQGEKAKVAELFAKLPGADDLAQRHGGDGAKGGGLLGMLGGGLMGGPLAAVTKLTAAGLSMDQIKTMGSEVLAYARQKAGPQLVKDVAGSIPGLSAYV
ncbi:MAG: DUF2780 domain-containing protein [Hyphomicrobiales bacterium]